MDLISVSQKRIGVFMGGLSEEREVSMKSGKAIVGALSKKGYQARSVILDQENETYIADIVQEQKIDIAFIALHGGFGEDGRIQEIFERLKVPYTGSGSHASFYAMDKIKFKEIMQHHGIRVPHFYALHQKTFGERITHWEHFPCVVKPHAWGSSKGVFIVKTINELIQHAHELLEQTEWVLVEEYIQGKELTIGILQEKALAPIEIIPVASTFFDYESKYTKGATKYVLPADIDSNYTRQAQQLALKVHTVLGCQDFSRIDMILTPSGEWYVLELNSIPGFTSCSLLPLAAGYAGITFENLCEQIVLMARTGRDHYEETNAQRTQTEKTVSPAS